MVTTVMQHPWRPTAAVFFVNGAVFGIWATQIPLAKDRLGLDEAVLGLVLLVLGAGAVTAMAASGWAIRRWGAGAIVRWSGLAFCTLLPVTAIAPNAGALAVLLFMFGAAGGMMDVSMNAHGAAVERQSARAYMSSFHGMWSVGGLVGAALGSLALSVLSGPLQALLAALVLGALHLLAQPFLIERPETEEGAGLASLRPEGVAVVIGVLAGLCFAAEGAILDWSSLYMRSELGAATEMAGAGFAAFSATMAVGRFLGDWIRAHIGATHIVRIGAALGVAGLLLGPATDHPALAVVGFALAGLGLSNIVPVLISAAGASRHPETAIATVTTLGYAGLLAAPPLLGLVAHRTSLATAFAIAAAMCVIIAAGAVMARRANLARQA
jgi:predicted MFS family arabinose efflux permease